MALYDIRRKNISTPDANNPGVSLPVGEQSSRGLELAGGLRLSRQVTLQANMAFVAPRYDDFSQTVNGVAVSRNGKVPTNTPRRIANVWVDYAFLPDWTASAAARYVGKTYADAANTTWAPAYMVFDAAVSHRIDRNLTVTARVRNLTDKVYAANVSSAGMFYLGAARVRTDAASALLRTAMSALPQTRPRAATGPSLAARAKRWLYLLHRWAGITLCLFFAMWFISGVVMMYVGYPKLTPAERLGHLAPLDPAGVTVTPAQALAAAGLEDGAALSLSASRAGQAVYLAGGGGARRQGGGRRQRRAVARGGRAGGRRHGLGLVRRGLPVRYAGAVAEDIYTHSRALDQHRPLHRVDVADPEHTRLYISSATGAVVLDATRAERAWNYVGAWIHWLYPFRGNALDRWWHDIVVWLSVAGVTLALTGTVVGLMRWRFSRPYASGSRSPYRENMMRWHHLSGLLFAVVTITWIFSGLMSMNPWKLFASSAARWRRRPMKARPGPPPRWPRPAR